MKHRILAVALVTPSSPQTGLRDALQKFGEDGYVEFLWMKEISFGVQHMRDKLVKLASEYKPTICFMQIQTPDILDADTLRQIPGFKVSWCGDVRNNLCQWAIDMAPHVDVTCFTNMRDVESMRALGYPSEFLNIGFSPTVFHPNGIKQRFIPDVVFLGNHYMNHFPCSQKRAEMVRMLQTRYRNQFCVYGRGWFPVARWLDEGMEAMTYRGCKIAIDFNHYCDVPRFFSDRRLRIMASGAFCIANHNPGIEEDFEVGKHLVTFKDYTEIPQIINRYLSRPADRLTIAKAGCEHVWKNHSWERRIEDLQGIVSKYETRPADLPPPRKINPTPAAVKCLRAAVDGWRESHGSLGGSGNHHDGSKTQPAAG